MPETKATEKPDAETISSWSYDKEGHAKKYVDRYCELAKKTIQQQNKVATPCMDDHQFEGEEHELVGELSAVCSHIVLKCLYLARIGRLDILWSVNKLARAVAKWTKSCDKRLARLISYIHHTSECRQYCYSLLPNKPSGKHFFLFPSWRSRRCPGSRRLRGRRPRSIKCQTRRLSDLFPLARLT